MSQVGKGLTQDEKYCGFKEIELKISVKQLSCGMEHSMLLTVNGEVFTAGNNTRGQMGISEEVSPMSNCRSSGNPPLWD
jgi:alpha-tubulin suppressor-like RCC1 family protein